MQSLQMLQTPYILKLGHEMLFYHSLGKHTLRRTVKYILLSEKIHNYFPIPFRQYRIVLKEKTVVEVR
jgi:hypothetical protein